MADGTNGHEPSEDAAMLEAVPSAAAAPETERPSPEALVAAIAAQAADKKARDIVELDLRGILGYTDYFVVCTGNTDRQTKAIHDGILRGLKDEHGLTPRRVEGLAQARWILMDYLDVVVHIFTPDTREYYRLEALWGEAPLREVAED
jgi:ribosome-associated protein